MEFQTLRKSHKKQIIMGALVICVIGGAITFATTRAKYKVTQDIKLVNGTVNYKVPDLRVVAINISEDGNNYTNTNEIPTDGYELNSSKSICKVYDGKTSIEETPKDNNITIEYKEGKINILGVNRKNTRCYLYFDKKKEPTSEDTLAKLGITNVKETTPDFSQVATTDEGIFKVTDGMYDNKTSYYWRGASTTNHLIFANKCWRIIRINGDGSIRIIYNGTPSGIAPNQSCPRNGSNSGSIAVTSQTYNASYDRSEYVGWTYIIGVQRTISGTTSNTKSQTDTWYNNNIGNNGAYKDKVVDGKFCNDRNTGSGYTWSSQPSSAFYYAGYDRSGAKSTTNVTPTLSCSNSGDVYTLKAGAITMDEVVMAGAKFGTPNSSYYLYNGQSYWTMSPSNWFCNSSSNRYAQVFIVGSNGFLSTDYVHSECGLRPVINLKAGTTFATGGNGTQSNPYVVQ